jgi:hypothetical protein
MLRRFTKLVPKNKYEIAAATVWTGTICGVGSGSCLGYNYSRSLPYSECLAETIFGAFSGGYFGFIAAITLPITLPVVVCTTVVRLADDILYKQDQNAYGKLVFKNIKMNIEDIFD